MPEGTGFPVPFGDGVDENRNAASQGHEQFGSGTGNDVGPSRLFARGRLEAAIAHTSGPDQVQVFA